MNENAGSSGSEKSTKSQKRIAHIIERIPVAREQLLAAIDDLGPAFTIAAVQEAAQSGDPRERNKVAVIERELDVLIAYLEELASRGISEAKRMQAVQVDSGHTWDRLAELHVISKASAGRLQNVKDMRNELAHAYPPLSWRALHNATEILLDELDSFTVRISDWLSENGVR
jgi:uncharacterized protein YutE (UPF0331/DUF86 family)